MLHPEEWMDLQLMQKQGHSIREIARMTGRSRNTVRRILRQRTPQGFQTPQKLSKLDAYKDYLRQRYAECGLSAVRLLDEIRPMGYTGSIIILRRYLRTLEPDRIVRQKATVRFETPPGYQAQADWGFCGKFPDREGRLVPIYVFVMVMGYSRMLYVEFATSMKVEELIRCHQNAFEFFGGWPQTILYDNMKQVRIDRQNWNRQFLDFAHHHGFTPRTHQPYRARTKGKVERMVDYVKDNFLNGRSFGGWEDLNAQARHWLSETANVRIHGTTGRKPVELFAQEKLSPLAAAPVYRRGPTIERLVSREGYIHYEQSRYSVPPKHVGQRVIVEDLGQKIVVRTREMIVTEHPKASKPGQCVVAKEHVEALWKLSLLRPMPPTPKWQMTFDSIVQAIPLSVYQEVGR
jgi:transposase